VRRIAVSLILSAACVLATSLPAIAQDVPAAYRGIWKQESVTCSGETPVEPVRELEFLNDGEFLITYQPFENYHDFWGTVAYDRSTGAFALNITGGNRIPTFVEMSGQAEFASPTRLVLAGFFLSAPRENGGHCNYVFGR
jgi:hypothetical protein